MKTLMTLTRLTRLGTPVLTLAALVGAVMMWPDGAASHVTTTNTVLFDREVVDILDRHCVGCHGTDTVAAPLVSYEQTWLARDAVLASVLERHMPPWAAVAGYGRFANDNSLTLRETQFLISWVEGLGPRNDGAVFLNVRDPGDVPPEVRANTEAPGWTLGEPDRVIDLEPVVVGPGQGARIERQTIDPGFDGDVAVRAIEYIPGAGGVVRAVTFRVEETGQWLAGWTPWHGVVELPEGVRYRLRAGSRIAVEITYGVTNVRREDRGRLGLYLDAGAGDFQVPFDIVLESTGPVPAGATDARFQADVEVSGPINALALAPQFEPGIESIEVTARRPDGGTDILLFARDIPVDWPTPYVFAEAVPVMAGSRLRVTAYYANSSGAQRPGGIRVVVSAYE